MSRLRHFVLVALLISACSSNHGTTESTTDTSIPSGPTDIAASPVQDCTETGPTDKDVQEALRQAPPTNNRNFWQVDAQGHTSNCQFYWVSVVGGFTAGSPEVLLFFNQRAWVGNSTPEARPYVKVVSSGIDTVTVRYSWRGPGDPGCCPSNHADVRYHMATNGDIATLDPVPPPPES